ncbi:uncharacterized protein LOC132304049 [Cornus florida]|uniref:uncharacterized protein LOC132304049 n=1 Tax=Cornus florida TaxID=4283 RepID=UPI002898E61B|nr:uncharacterized protein LOC132304049 [Cornus florida]
MSSSRPLTTASRLFSMSLRRLQHHHRFKPFSPSAAHSFSTGPTPYTKLPFDPRLYTKNPFGVAEQNGAPRTAYDKTIVNDSFYVVRWDLPGIASEDLKIWVNEKKELVLEGKIKGEPKYEYSGGDYSCSIPSFPELFHVEQFTAELKHGVVWIILPLTEMAKKAMKYEPEVFGKRTSSDFNS